MPAKVASSNATDNTCCQLFSQPSFKTQPTGTMRTPDPSPVQPILPINGYLASQKQDLVPSIHWPRGIHAAAEMSVLGGVGPDCIHRAPLVLQRNTQKKSTKLGPPHVLQRRRECWEVSAPTAVKGPPWCCSEIPKKERTKLAPLPCAAAET